jgi:phosphoribosylamine--glycine ligase
MKVLVIGSGGREHALCWKIAQSERVEKVYCAPGNGGTRLVAENVDIKANDIEGLLNFALENEIDLTVVGPEDPLALGIVDKFQEKGLKIFGPDKKCALLEGSKSHAKQFMKKYNIPTANYMAFNSFDEAVRGLDEFSYPVVIKADGLCLGKGVEICNTREEAVKVLEDILVNKKFGSEGKTVVIEEFLDGVEASLLCFVSANRLIPMESAKDYKRIYEGDSGPNTGGVGCISPSPIITEELMEKVEKEIIDRIQYGLEEEGLRYKGILYIGLMIVKGEPKVLEFNVRFGDPETEVLMPRLDTDIVELFERTIEGTLEPAHIRWKEDNCLTVVLTSKGYPLEYEKGFQITGWDNLDEDIILFHNGTKYEAGKLLTNGGRVLSVTALGKTLEEARKKVYGNIDKIHFNGAYYRRDIGK